MAVIQEYGYLRNLCELEVGYRSAILSAGLNFDSRRGIRRMP